MQAISLSESPCINAVVSELVINCCTCCFIVAIIILFWDHLLCFIWFHDYYCTLYYNCTLFLQMEPIRGFRIENYIGYMQQLEEKFRSVILPDMLNFTKQWDNAARGLHGVITDSAVIAIIKECLGMPLHEHKLLRWTR